MEAWRKNKIGEIWRVEKAESIHSHFSVTSVPLCFKGFRFSTSAILAMMAILAIVYEGLYGFHSDFKNSGTGIDEE
jgi:hypothetical protein